MCCPGIVYAYYVSRFLLPVSWQVFVWYTSTLRCCYTILHFCTTILHSCNTILQSCNTILHYYTTILHSCTTILHCHNNSQNSEYIACCLVITLSEILCNASQIHALLLLNFKSYLGDLIYQSRNKLYQLLCSVLCICKSEQNLNK